MTTANYKSTIGGAFSALGSTLIGIGVVPQLAGAPSKTLLYVAVAGFTCQAIGQFLAHLFSADAKVVKDLAEQVNTNTNAILSGDTSHLRKVELAKP